MPFDTRFDPERFVRTLASRAHGGLIGLRYVGHGPDWAELAIDYRDALVGDPDSGVLASGPILALMDMATSMAIWIRQDQFRAQATLDLRIDYLRPATPGRAVIGRGECYRLTRSIAFVRGQAHDGDPDDPIAHVAGTYMFTDLP
ncbi:hotdog fold thioesterase [Sphingomonas changnyeongensis]|uniref:Hotdog fold thioesterase n=1 Tax=Sphingomonas changnyeongensis TaxID=2698679 RepID=A0A7Z2NUS1_9SPHN|nr:PaaI family thioesterase [Sphingomonas changnyeongensis]QHL90203.1 hotdog fold thioesterase [Sphingomonas changnyeongensis]